MWMAAAFVPERGKGGHGTLYYGEKLPIVRNLVLIGIKLEN